MSHNTKSNAAIVVEVAEWSKGRLALAAYVQKILTLKDKEREEAVRENQEKRINDLIILSAMIIKGEVTVDEYLQRWRQMLQTLTTPLPESDRQEHKCQSDTMLTSYPPQYTCSKCGRTEIYPFGMTEIYK